MFYDIPDEQAVEREETCLPRVNSKSMQGKLGSFIKKEHTKRPRLSHCQSVVLSQEVKKEEGSRRLSDYFGLRSQNIFSQASLFSPERKEAVKQKVSEWKQFVPSLF